MDETRDIAIETKAKVEYVANKLDEFIDESRRARSHVDRRLDSHEALVNKARGAWWAVGLVGVATGWIGSHLPWSIK